MNRTNPIQTDMVQSIVDIIVCFIIASSYVIFIYVHVPIELQNKDRNDISLIKFRLYRITLLCSSLFILVPFIKHYSFIKWIKLLHIIPGFTETGNTFVTDINNIFHSLILMIVLFIGPISTDVFLIDGEFSFPTIHRLYHNFLITFVNIYGIRDYVFAPITEEFIFRAIILNISPSKFINYTPFLFGIAHIHHGYYLYKQGKYELNGIITSVFIQLIYTTVFGYLSNYVWYKYSSLWGNVLVHSLCNIMGLPDFMLNSTPAINMAYYGLLMAGVYGFIVLL